MSKVIMIQGTMSNVGKSLIAGGLCRGLARMGYRVAPFKSQNMALNSFVTEEGLEIGRAQAMQAECARVKPSVYMNPILLKPTNDTGSQVIVNGEVFCNMSAKEYFSYKKRLVPQIMAAFNKLSEWADVIVIEGAGSPAEINLKADDIVNMGLAELVDAPVLLVGDIDRGGVFAQLLGTLELLEPHERDRVKGLIINKFRGDKSLLDSGISMLEDMGRVPVIGTIPYVHLMIDDEDSLSDRLDNKFSLSQLPAGEKLNIAVVRLPRISNFTDVAPFECLDNVSLRFITSPKEIDKADLLILPGSKNTIADMKWLYESGIASAIISFARNHPVIGICGGFQMLGDNISDPDGVENSIKSIRGLGLLGMNTVLRQSKHLSQARGRFEQVEQPFSALSGQEYVGYEIHNGQSTILDKEVKTVFENNIFGTYIHGIFDNGDLAYRLIKDLADKKGLPIKDMQYDYQGLRDAEYDKLADAVMDNIDRDFILDLLK